MREKKQGWMEGQNKIKEECREKYQIKEKDNSNWKEQAGKEKERWGSGMSSRKAETNGKERKEGQKERMKWNNRREEGGHEVKETKKWDKMYGQGQKGVKKKEEKERKGSS